MSDLGEFTYRCVCGEGMHILPVHAGRLAPCPRCGSVVLLPEELGNLAKQIEPDLKTERLSLTLATPKDAGRLLPILSHAKNYEFEIEPPHNPKTVRRMLKESVFPRGFKRSGRMRFLMFEEANERVVGLIHLNFDPLWLTAGIGFMVHEPYQRQGFAKEGISRVVEFCLSDLNLQRIGALCDSKNAACRACLESCDFVGEGEMRFWLHHDRRGWIHSSIYARYHPDRDREKDGKSASGDA